MWGKKKNAWEVKPVELKDISLDDQSAEPIHLFDVALGIAIGVAVTLLCVGILRI